ncbi:MAG TPA: hypothetical protein VJ921_11745 [Vicinamibacteria bacterium]|nr:hypothetical protein [Vicinamibacteria bacterium]
MTLLLALVISLTVSTREEAPTLLRRVIESQKRQQELTREYAFRETTVTRELDSEGRVEKTESEEVLVTPGPEGEYRRVVGKDGKPLSSEEELKEERKFQKYLKEQLRQSPEERDRKTKEKLDRRVKRFQERLTEAIEVFDFEARPDEIVQNVPLRVFRFSPKAGYEGHSRSTKILARMEGTVWIDPEHNQLAKLRVRFVKSLKFLGGVFGRVSEGSEAEAEGWFDGEGVWLLDDIAVSLNARLYFVKTYRQRIDIDYHDYQRYRVATEEKLKPPSRK